MILGMTLEEAEKIMNITKGACVMSAGLWKNGIINIVKIVCQSTQENPVLREVV